MRAREARSVGQAPMIMEVLQEFWLFQVKDIVLRAGRSME